jgi:hypothetical protein
VGKGGPANQKETTEKLRCLPQRSTSQAAPHSSRQGNRRSLLRGYVAPHAEAAQARVIGPTLRKPAPQIGRVNSAKGRHDKAQGQWLNCSNCLMEGMVE